MILTNFFFFFFSSRRRHTRFKCDWSSDVCSSDLSGLRACLEAHQEDPSPQSTARQPRRKWGPAAPAVLQGLPPPQRKQRRSFPLGLPAPGAHRPSRSPLLERRRRRHRPLPPAHPATRPPVHLS